MWPAMIEEPISPGRGLLVYQPATEGLLGICSVPRWVMPSRISLVCTPMAGIHSATGGGGAVMVEVLGSGAGAPGGVRPAGAALAGVAQKCTIRRDAGSRDKTVQQQVCAPARLHADGPIPSANPVSRHRQS